jgi:DNA mismatch repair protein MutS
VKLEQETARAQSQRDLFSDPLPTVDASPPEEHPVLASLRAIVPDELSPRQALEELYALKKAAEKE